MTFRAIRRPGSKVVAPFGEGRIVIESGNPIPRHAIVFAFEKPDRTGSREPDAGLAGVSWCEKEYVIEREPLPPSIVRVEVGIPILFFRPKTRRPFGLFP